MGADTEVRPPAVLCLGPVGRCAQRDTQRRRGLGRFIVVLCPLGRVFSDECPPGGHGGPRSRHLESVPGRMGEWAGFSSFNNAKTPRDREQEGPPFVGPLLGELAGIGASRCLDEGYAD
jgi:hypothetical protein